MWQGYTEWLSAPRMAEELGMDVGRVRSWATRRDDPLPVRYIDGNRRQWRVRRKEMDDWLMRNSVEGVWRWKKEMPVSWARGRAERFGNEEPWTLYDIQGAGGNRNRGDRGDGRHRRSSAAGLRGAGGKARVGRMKERKPTQNDRIMRYMRDFGSITSADAMRDLGVMRLASRVSDLKSQGVRISDTWETAKNRYGEPVSYKRYRLEEGCEGSYSASGSR